MALSVVCGFVRAFCAARVVTPPRSPCGQPQM